ncbi:hypothetical protein ACFLRO_01630 [Bacteroidota bacterium]
MPVYRAFVISIFGLSLSLGQVAAQDFEEAVVSIGNVGVTVTNSGFFGKASVRANPTGPPSFEYPLDSGIEHLFESGLWIGAIRSDRVVSVRTGAITSSGGYRPGATGYELAPSSIIRERSRLLGSDAFNTSAVSHQDFIATFTDTAFVLPGTSIPMPDPAGRLNASITMSSYAWNFPFAESFVVLNFDITNVGDATWDSVFVGLYHDLVVRNVNTTTETGSAFFNKNGLGQIDSVMATYAFNAGGIEESINTYGASTFLGAEWRDPATGEMRYIHPNVADELEEAGLPVPVWVPRWWGFSAGTDPELTRPANDLARYRRMGTLYPNPDDYLTEEELEDAREAWATTLRTGGLSGNGNWIGLESIGPVSSLPPGDTLRATFALVAAAKPQEFQTVGLRPVDTDETRELLLGNVNWAHRTYQGEDLNNNGKLDPGEDANGDGKLTRYLIPEPPSSPLVRPELSAGTVSVYWDASSETSRDPVTGQFDFEGYRIYRSNPGDDRAGDLIGAASLIAQYDIPGNNTGFNNGFEPVRLESPVTFPGDPTIYEYVFVDEGVSSGWQYAYAITAFDRGDVGIGLPTFESSKTSGAVRVFPGTAADNDGKVGVYPNPYRVNAAWDGATSKTRRLNFYNLPSRSEIRVYTLAGEVVAAMEHDAASYNGDIRWYDDFSAEGRVLPGGEHSWDLLSDNGLALTSGLYFFTVKDVEDGSLQTGKFAIIK